MRINRLGLLNSLFTVLNDNSPDDSSAVLAKYFLENYKHLSELNIFDVAAECFVSRSSVRRFCKSLGYGSFLDLKNEFREYDDKMALSIKHYGREEYRIKLTSEINEMIEELDYRMDTEEIDMIIKTFHDARYVIMLTSDASTSIIKVFQQAMALYGKIIYLISDSYEDHSMLQEASEKDCIVAISVTGVFATAVCPYLKDNPAYKMLFTGNRDAHLYDSYDKVYHLSKHDVSDERSFMYSKYGVDYAFDIILAAYVNAYKDES